MHKTAIAAFALALAAALATGCSSAPPMRFYLVTPLDGAQAAAPSNLQEAGKLAGSSMCA